MSRKHTWRSTILVSAGAAACLLLGSGRTPLGVDVSVAGTKIKAAKVQNFQILAGGLGEPTAVTMVNQVVPRISMYSASVVPLVDVLARTDLLVATNNNLSGLPPVAGFPPGAVVRVRRPSMPSGTYPPPDTNGDGISDNVVIFTENNANFVGSDAQIITVGSNITLDTFAAGDDTSAGGFLRVGPNGIAESGRCGDDGQSKFVGTGSLSSTTVVILPGSNGILETNPIGDDLVGPSGGCPLNNICAGPNGIAQSGRGGDDQQLLPCVGRFLQPRDIVLEGGGIGSLTAGNRILETPVKGDDVPVIVAALDQNSAAVNNSDADTTPCQNPDGTPVAGCDDVQVLAAGTVISNAGCTGAGTPFACCTGAGTGTCNITTIYGISGRTEVVVGPGDNGELETPPNSAIMAGNDLDADTTVCRTFLNPSDLVGTPINNCDDVQLVPVGTTGLTAATKIVGPGPDHILQTPPRVNSLSPTNPNRDVASFDAQAVQAGPNRTGETGPAAGDDVQVVEPLTAPNVSAPPVSAPVGISSVVSMYPAVANMGDPIGYPTQSGSVAFLSSGPFSVGSNGDGTPEGDNPGQALGVAQPGPKQVGTFTGAEGAREGSNGLLSGLAGFTYGGFDWTDLSFKINSLDFWPPSLKGHAYYATRQDGGIVLIAYQRGRVNDVLAPGILDAPTGIAFLAPSRSLCIGADIFGDNGQGAQCGTMDPLGTDAGRLFVIESGTGRIAKIPLEISNVTSDNGLCASTDLGLSRTGNTESGQGVFCDPKTLKTLDGSSCPDFGTCHTTGVGLPNTRIVANVGAITYMTPQFVTNPVAVVMATGSPVPHTGRLTSGADGIADTHPCHGASVSCDDAYVIYHDYDGTPIPMQVGHGFPNGREIDALLLGGAATLQTAPLGDDVPIGGVVVTQPQIPSPPLPASEPLTTITTGPDGIADTQVCHNVVGTCTDVEDIQYGHGDPFKAIIEAGPDGILQTTPEGDDRVVDSPTLLVANADGTVVWMDLNGFDPVTHTGIPRLFKTPLKNITGMAVGDFVNGEGLQVLVTTRDFGGAVASFDLTLADNSPSLVATIQILTDLNDNLSQKDRSICSAPGTCSDPVIDPGLPPLVSPLPTGLTHVALDYYPGPDGFVGTPDDPHFNNPNYLGDPSNITLIQQSEPNELTVNGLGGVIYADSLDRRELVLGGSYSVNTLVYPDPSVTEMYLNFISGRIQVNVGRFPNAANAILAGPDGVVQTAACHVGGDPANPALIPNCDDFQLTPAGSPVWSGPRGMKILAGPDGTCESGLGGDDVQFQPVGKTFGVPGVTTSGQPYTLWTPTEVGVGPGSNGVLDTPPGSDDTTTSHATQHSSDCSLPFRPYACCTGPGTGNCECTTPNSICTGPNGVVNSGLGGDDVQLLPPGTSGLSPTTPCVGPGSDGFMETSPGGDDLLGGGQPLDIAIHPGPDGILQTPPAPGDVASRLTPITVADLDLYAYSRPIVPGSEYYNPSQPYAFLDPAGANAGVVDINNGRTSNSLDAAVDAGVPVSTGAFGPNFESPTGETDFIIRNISLTAVIDNTTGLVFGRGVEGKAKLPALSFVYLDSSLAPVNNYLVGSSIVGRQIVRSPAQVFQPDQALAKKKK